MRLLFWKKKVKVHEEMPKATHDALVRVGAKKAVAVGSMSPQEGFDYMAQHGTSTAGVVELKVIQPRTKVRISGLLKAVGAAPTRMRARALIALGHITLNGETMTCDHERRIVPGAVLSVGTFNYRLTAEQIGKARTK